MSNLSLDLPTANTAEAFETYLDHITARSDAGRKIGHNTYAMPGEIVRGGVVRRCVHIRYHSTIIATWIDNGLIQLDSGGYRTVTTKSRLNLIGRRLGFRVWQSDFAWYLGCSMGERDFADGISTLGDRRCAIGCECGAR